MNNYRKFEYGNFLPVHTVIHLFIQQSYKTLKNSLALFTDLTKNNHPLFNV
jgi:hypothetical protein